jgi:hypothetical protein
MMRIEVAITIDKPYMRYGSDMILHRIAQMVHVTIGIKP